MTTTMRTRTGSNAHHVAFDKVKPKRHLLNTLIKAVDTLFGIREDNVGFLVVACQHPLFNSPPRKKQKETRRQQNEERRNQRGRRRWWNWGGGKQGKYTQRLWRVRLGERGERGLILFLSEMSCAEDKIRKRTVDVALETGHRIDVSLNEAQTRRGGMRGWWQGSK
jgi:hypothetical protein